MIRDGENGWQYRDEADFQDKLARLLSAPRDRLARSARATAEEYSAQRFAERVEGIYEEQIPRHALERREVSA